MPGHRVHALNVGYNIWLQRASLPEACPYCYLSLPAKESPHTPYAPLHAFIKLFSASQHYKSGISITLPILQKPMHREGKGRIQGHTAPLGRARMQK